MDALDPILTRICLAVEQYGNRDCLLARMSLPKAVA